VKIIEFGPTFFVLPDEFVGGVAAALRLLADYYESKPKQTESQQETRGRPTKVAVEYERFRKERLGKFVTAVSEGAKLDGLISLIEGDVVSLQEVDIDGGWAK